MRVVYHGVILWKGFEKWVRIEADSCKAERINMRIIICVVGLLMVAVAGCASVRIVGREENPKEIERFAAPGGWSWDLEGGKEEIPLPDDRATLGSVELHSSYWYAWGTVLTFGWWIPFDITYEVNQ